MEKDEFYCIGTKEEVDNFERGIDFGDKEMNSRYNMLLPKYRTAVKEVLFKLDSREFFGYNLKRVLKAYNETTKAKEFQEHLSSDIKKRVIGKYIISQQLEHDCKEGYLDQEGILLSASDFDAKDIDNRLDRVCSGTATIKENSDVYLFVQAICDYLMIDMDLLKTGRGKDIFLKEEWISRYNEDEEFQALANSNMKDTWNPRLRTKYYEKYLRKIGQIGKEETIFEERYAVMTYSGTYIMLSKEKGKANEAEAVKWLVGYMHALQLINGEMPNIPYGIEP
ncbi:MAG: hypothetical protein LUH55_09855 [Bacteroides thetaiotaomicron]|nr:hypothetical protein [Bacteroides thetaiotaomicron]